MLKLVSAPSFFIRLPFSQCMNGMFNSFLIRLNRVRLKAVLCMALVFALHSIYANAQTSAPGADSNAPKSSADEQYQHAREAFEKGEFKKAEELARGLLRKEHLSSELFQLLGHISYRRDELGQAALWYERATLFPTPSVELRQNIMHIRSRTGNVNFPSNGFRDQYAAFLTRSQWFYIGGTSLWVFVIAVTVYYFFRRRSAARVFLMLVRVLALVTATLAGLGWYWHPSYDKVERLAVITEQDARAYTAASTGSGMVMNNIPPGSGVKKLEERGAWTYVEIPTEQLVRGWVESRFLTSYWPFNPAYLE